MAQFVGHEAVQPDRRHGQVEPTTTKVPAMALFSACTRICDLPSAGPLLVTPSALLQARSSMVMTDSSDLFINRRSRRACSPRVLSVDVSCCSHRTWVMLQLIAEHAVLTKVLKIARFAEPMRSDPQPGGVPGRRAENSTPFPMPR